MDLAASLLDGWLRQCRIMDLLAERVDESNADAKPSDDGWPLRQQLAHIHRVRQYHLHELSPERAAALPNSLLSGWDNPIQDLDVLRDLLRQSAQAVHDALEEAFARPVGPIGAYDNAAIFLQHLTWHEGWHAGLIFLALRQAGQEIPEEWEEAHVWAEFRRE